MLEGRFILRICVLNFRTHLDRMEMCLEDIRAAAREVLEPGGHEAEAPGAVEAAL